MMMETLLPSAPGASPSSWEIWDFQAWGPWLTFRLIHAFVFILGAFVVDRIWRLFLKRVQHIAGAHDPTKHRDLERRVQTLTLLLRRLGSAVVYTAAFLMILGDFGVAIGPLLAGLGIVGVAVGFGAQYLVKDLITGFFVVLEDQFRVGDSVKINEFTGTVEHMTLRITEIRGQAGEVHTVPNGDIRWVTNFSREWSRAIVDIPVARDAPPEDVTAVLAEAGKRLQHDPTCGPMLLEAPEVQGIVALDSSSATVRAWVKTLPLKRLDVERAFRRLILEVMEERSMSGVVAQRTYLMHVPSTGSGEGKP